MPTNQEVSMSELKDIGETAGQVWNFLHASGKSTLTAVEHGVRAPKSRVYMAVGWLAREGKVELRQEKRAVQLWLRDH